MTKSTTVVFILGFAILFKLEKKVCSQQETQPLLHFSIFVVVMESLYHSNNDLCRTNIVYVQSHRI